MNYDQHPDRRREIAELAFTLSWLVVRHYARAYLVRTSGPAEANGFFRHADKRLLLAIGSFVSLLVLACLVSYASVGVGLGLFFVGLVIAIAMCIPPGVTMIRYAERERQYRRQTRGPLATRLYQTGNDYFPRLFQ